MYRKSFAEQHPVLLGVGILFCACFVAALWWLFLALAVLAAIGVGVAGICVGVLCLARYAERQNQLRYRRRAELASHADYEHALLLRGDPRGTFGQFPPYRV
jgi:hypothetical protein